MREIGKTIPTIGKVSALYNLLEANEPICFSPSVIASHYSETSINMINYGQINSDYLDCLNHFMHPDNYSSLFNSVTLTAWKDFLSKRELADITSPLKSLIIDTFQNYQSFTPLNSLAIPRNHKNSIYFHRYQKAEHHFHLEN